MKSKPQIQQVTPRAAISGGEIFIHGRGLSENGASRPVVRFGETPASVVISSESMLVVRVPEGAVSGEITVDTGKSVSAPAPFDLAVPIADNLHPVANPALDAAGNIFATFSGSRGQKVAVSVYKIDLNHTVRPFLNDFMNPTGLAFDRDEQLYISSRLEGTVYKVTPDGQRSVYAEGMGIATGLAFDEEENLLVGDRSGTIFKISHDRQIFVFATLEPSVAAYHLAFGADRYLYVSGPTTSSYDAVYRISPAGETSIFYRGLGRPQGLAFDVKNNLYVAASLSGRRGIVRITPDGQADLAVSGIGLVGLAFSKSRGTILATQNALYQLPWEVEGKPLLG